MDAASFLAFPRSRAQSCRSWRSELPPRESERSEPGSRSTAPPRAQAGRRARTSRQLELPHPRPPWPRPRRSSRLSLPRPTGSRSRQCVLSPPSPRRLVPSSPSLVAATPHRPSSPPPPQLRPPRSATSASAATRAASRTRPSGFGPAAAASRARSASEQMRRRPRRARRVRRTSASSLSTKSCRAGRRRGSESASCPSRPLRPRSWLESLTSSPSPPPRADSPGQYLGASPYFEELHEHALTLVSLARSHRLRDGRRRPRGRRVDSRPRVDRQLPRLHHPRPVRAPEGAGDRLPHVGVGREGGGLEERCVSLSLPRCPALSRLC